MILSLFGFLVNPSDQYTSSAHRNFSHCFVWLITTVVGAVTPLCFIAVGIISLLVPFSASTLLPYWRSTLALFSFAVIEMMWYFYCWKLKRSFSTPTSFPGLSPQERSFYLDRVLEHCQDPWSTLVRWFYPHPPEHVGIECMAEWLSWAFFSKDKSTLSTVEGDELDKLVAKVVERCPRIGKASADYVRESPEFMRLHFDKLVSQHKPFIAYVVVSAMQLGGSIYLKSIGFHHHSFKSNNLLSYWSYCPQRSSRITENNVNDIAKPPTPIVIVHGIGIGVTMYINVIKAVVAKNPSRPVFILELPYISLKIVGSVPTMNDTVEAVDEMFSNHNLDAEGCSWLAHSYGTIVTAWVMKERPKYIRSLVFVDPVCFSLWEPDLIYNFLYRPPVGPIHRVCQFFVAQDLLVSYTLFRNFWWLQNILFPQDIHCPTKIFLSSHDFIIDAIETGAYLKRQQDSGGERLFEVVKMQGLSHGSFLNSNVYIRQIVDSL